MKPRLVLDASAALHTVLLLQHSEVLLNLLEETPLVIAPDLYSTEVANGLWKYVRARQMSSDVALMLHEQAVALTGRFEKDTDLLREALSAAMDHQHPVYDMLYAVLARRNGCPVVTLDQRMIRLLEKMDIEAFHPVTL